MTTPTSVVESLHADGSVAGAHLKRELEMIVRKFTEVSQAMGHTFNVSKTKVRHQLHLEIHFAPPFIRIHGEVSNTLTTHHTLQSPLKQDKR